MGRSNKKRAASGRPRLPETPDIPAPPIRQTQPPAKKQEAARRADARAQKRAKTTKTGAPARGDIPEPPVRHTGWVWDRAFIALIVTVAFVFLTTLTVAVIVDQIAEHVYVSIVMAVLALLIGMVNRRGRS
jgi:hypothetical protein